MISKQEYPKAGMISHRDYVEYTNANTAIIFNELTLKSDNFSRVSPFSNSFDKSVKVPHLEILERSNL